MTRITNRAILVAAPLHVPTDRNVETGRAVVHGGIDA